MTGISGLIYKSVHGRERLNGYQPTCDISWLHEDFEYTVNPLNIGQIVNNSDKIHKANVMYEELTIETEDYIKVLQLLPNINYDSGFAQQLKLEPLIAIKDINEGEELFSTYFSIV